MKVSEAAARVIDLSRKVRAYYNRELPKWHPGYPLIRADEEGPPPPAEARELRQYLRSLPDSVIYRLIFIMYLGRGDYGAADLESGYANMKRTFSNPEWAVSQMMGKAPLADYLSDGLAELKRRKISVDSLPVEGTPQATT